MNVVLLEGVVSSEPLLRDVGSGVVSMSFDLRSSLDGHAASVPVVWPQPDTDVTLRLHDVVRVVGGVKRRFFRSGGSTQSRTEVVASGIVAASGRDDLGVYSELMDEVSAGWLGSVARVNAG